MDESGPINKLIAKPPAKLLIAKLDGLQDPDPTFFEIFCYRPDKRLSATLKGSVSLYVGLQKVFTLPIEKHLGIWSLVLTITKEQKVEVFRYELEFSPDNFN